MQYGGAIAMGYANLGLTGCYFVSNVAEDENDIYIRLDVSGSVATYNWDAPHACAGSTQLDTNAVVTLYSYNCGTTLPPTALPTLLPTLLPTALPTVTPNY